MIAVWTLGRLCELRKTAVDVAFHGLPSGATHTAPRNIDSRRNWALNAGIVGDARPSSAWVGTLVCATVISRAFETRWLFSHTQTNLDVAGN
jgi:hypothetical protein